MKHPLLALALLAVAAAPATAAVTPTRTWPTPDGPVTEATLPNGLQLLMLENHVSPVVSFHLAYRVGSRNETLGQTGSAHLLEHMLFKGNRTFAKGQIAALLGRNGANYNATTTADATSFFETYASDRLELGFAVEASRMREAGLREDERRTEMTVVRNELENDETDPGALLDGEIAELAYRSHPYHHPTLGYRSDVEAIDASDLRRFYDTYYQPNNAVAVLVGDFTTRRALQLAHQYFDRIPRGAAPPRVYTTEEPQTGERRLQLRRRGETNLLEVAFHIPQAASHDLAALQVLGAVLTTGETSRMEQALIETGQGTRVWSDVGLQHDSALFRLGADLQPAQVGRADHAGAEKNLWAVLDHVKTSPIPARELARARRQTLSSLYYANEGAEDLATNLADFAIRDRWQRLYELQDEVASVSAEQIAAVARTYLTRDNASVGWYVATPDGPVPPSPTSLHGGRAHGAGNPAGQPPILGFERRPMAPAARALPARRRLGEGLEVWVLANPASRTVAFDGFVRAGSALDPHGKNGVAEAVANLLDAGSWKTDRLTQAHFLEDLGASLSFDAQPFATNISGQCLARDFDGVTDALAERLRFPAFPPEELEKLTPTWKATVIQGEDDPTVHAQRAFMRGLYPPGHPLFPLLPAEASKAIDAITRQDLLAYHRRHYGPNTTVLVVVGNVEPTHAFAKIEEAFNGWRRVTPQDPKLPAPLPARAETVAVDLPESNNVQILLGHAANVRRSDPAYYAYELANDVLGGDTWTSRLGAKLRDEMGLTYGCYSELDAGQFPGPWDASVTVNPANARRAIKALRTELDRFVAQGIDDQALLFAKRAFIGAQAPTLATNVGMAHAIARIALYDLGLDHWTRYPLLVQAVTRDQVQAAARDLIQPEHDRLVVAGPGASEIVKGATK